MKSFEEFQEQWGKGYKGKRKVIIINGLYFFANAYMWHSYEKSRIEFFVSEDTGEINSKGEFYLIDIERIERYE